MTRTISVIFSIGWSLTILIIGSAEISLSEDQASFPSALASISGERMLADVAKLSSLEFNGRQAGTEEDIRAGELFLQRLYRLQFMPGMLYPGSASGKGTAPSCPLPGLIPGSTQSITVRTIGDRPLFQTSTTENSSPASIGPDYLPILDSPAADIISTVAFVGYGISDQTVGFDEYAGLDVRNKIVLFLRGKPDQYKKPVSHADKERTAREKGAIGYLTATGPVLNDYEVRRGVTGRPTAFYGLTPPLSSLPGAWISTELAGQIIAAGSDRQQVPLRRLQEEINQSVTPRSRVTSVSARMFWESRSKQGILCNVQAMLPGQHPLNREFIIIGAHRDHFGLQAGLVFPGADDNASGTAVLLEVARVMVQSGLKPKRSLLFTSFSGEELGLLGSRLYISQPNRPLETIKAMINVDHAAVGNGRLTVGVTGLEKTVALEAGRASGLADKLDLFGFFPGGDHVPFKEAGISTVTVVSGGVHPHFHQPTDTVETVNPEILETTARYVFAVLWQLANEP